MAITGLSGIEIKGVRFKESKRPPPEYSTVKEALNILAGGSRRNLATINRTRYCLPTSDWIAKFVDSPRHAKTFDGIELSFHDVMEKTLEITVAAVGNNTFSSRLPSTDDYQTLLSDYLMNLNVRWDMVKDEEDIVRIVEVSTRFYDEFRAHFRYMRLSDHEIRHIRPAGWLYNDMLVDILDDPARRLR